MPLTAESKPGNRWVRKPAPWLAAYAAWFILLWILSSSVRTGPDIRVPGMDKVYHFVYFAAGGTTLAVALLLLQSNRIPLPSSLPGPLSGRRIWWLTVASGALVGGLDEFHQAWVPGRSGMDLFDWLADLAGSLAAVPLARLMLRWLPAQQLVVQRVAQEATSRAD